MSKLSRTAALDYISKWSTEEVIEFLKKNGLEECCHAVLKRQIDGDELLRLTEGKLALWKSDLSRPQTWSLWAFVEELKRAPEDHVASYNIVTADQEVVSDSGSWGTDFEDEEDDDSAIPTLRKTNAMKNKISQQSNDFRNSLKIFQRNEKLAQDNKNISKPNDSPDGLYMNYGWEPEEEAENSYMNLESETVTQQKSVMQLHNKIEKSLAEQLKEQLKLFAPSESTSIKITKKTEISPEKPVKSAVKPHQASFLHNSSMPNGRIGDSKDVKKPEVPPPRPEKPPRTTIEKKNDLPKPPVMLRNFDLVRDLPMKTDESDDEYEPFDEQIIEQNRIQMGSKQSLFQGSMESVYKPPSTTSQETNDCEIYEVITENPDEGGYYIEPIVHPIPKDTPPSLSSSTGNPTESTGTSTITKPKIHKKRERSPDKKAATLPSSSSITSLSAEMRATRPLPPPPPFGEPYMETSWFHNITREQATALIKERACSSSHNGYFLLRPSTSDLNSPLVLVLWYKDRVYNVPVRKRPDGRYALGSSKFNEQTFVSVEDIIKFHSREELILYSGGLEMGSTKLTETPPRKI